MVKSTNNIITTVYIYNLQGIQLLHDGITISVLV